MATYPLSGYASPDIALAAVLTGWGRYVGACPVLPADNAASRRATVYAYEFAQDDGLYIGTFPMGATHGSELPYLFGSMPNLPPPNPALSRQMIAYWTQFAHTGNPNGPGTPYWPAYRPGGHVLALAAGPAGITQVDFATAHRCGFWATAARSQAR
jgi:para-nitrobenzyl esterase